MSEMTPEEQAERIRRLQARRGSAADAPSVRRKARRRHGMKTRVAVSALSVASFASLAGVMVVGGQSTATVAASKTSTSTSTAAASDDDSSSSSTASSSTASSSTASSSTASSSTASSQAVTATKGS